ncbi:MAG TPA: hypothetical protein VFV49_01745 [Thermoanaerobaculia bacterium]|nr:hypothetical protein [Thermoanaerobaculia bacterium]
MKFDVKRTMTLMAAAMLVLLAAASPAAAATQVIHDQDTFSVFVPCANGGLGETVDGFVKVQGVLSETSDGAGGVHFHFKFTLRGAGLGSVTGDTYRLHGDVPAFIIGNRLNDNAGGSFNAAIDYGVDAIGQGSASNFHSRARAQITVNANGVVTMEKGDFVPDETCN